MEQIDTIIREKLVAGNILILPQELAALPQNECIPLVSLYPGEHFAAPLEDKKIPRHKASIIEWCLSHAKAFENVPTETRRRIAIALVAREATLSCGIGNGLALPHCKTELIENPLELILTVAPEEIDWYSIDQAPTSVILIALFKANMPEAVSHRMQVSLVLARMLRETGLIQEIKSMREPALIAAACREALDSLKEDPRQEKADGPPEPAS